MPPRKHFFIDFLFYLGLTRSLRSGSGLPLIRCRSCPLPSPRSVRRPLRVAPRPKLSYKKFKSKKVHSQAGKSPNFFSQLNFLFPIYFLFPICLIFQKNKSKTESTTRNLKRLPQTDLFPRPLILKRAAKSKLRE